LKRGGSGITPSDLDQRDDSLKEETVKKKFAGKIYARGEEIGRRVFAKNKPKTAKKTREV